MLLLFLSAASGHPVALEAPAMATVRIVRAAEIRRDKLKATEESVKRETKIRESDGSLRSATLIEYY